MLTDEQKHAFIQDGYIVLNDILPKDLLEKILHDAHIIATKELPTVTHIDGELLEFNEPNSAKDAKMGELKGWYKRIFLNYPSFTDIYNIPAFVELLQELIGFDFQLVFGTLIIIPPTKDILRWHKDDNILNFPVDQIVVSIYLQSTVGTVRVIPGSHQNEYPLNHVLENEIPLGDVSLPGEVALVLPTGSILVNHANLWHTNDANNSNLTEWLLTLQYARAEDCVIKKA
jgi:hypothetical protein